MSKNNRKLGIFLYAFVTFLFGFNFAIGILKNDIFKIFLFGISSLLLLIGFLFIKNK